MDRPLEPGHGPTVASFFSIKWVSCSEELLYGVAGQWIRYSAGFQILVLPEALWVGKANTYMLFPLIAIKSSHCPLQGGRCNIHFLATRWLPGFPEA